MHNNSPTSSPAAPGPWRAVLLAVFLLVSPHLRAQVGDPQIGVQITELGLMRALLVLDESARESEDRIAQHLTEVDFRLTPAPRLTSGRMTPAAMREMAAAEDADLILYARASTRALASMQDFRLYEGEATTQIWVATTGELIASTTERTRGVRSTDDFAARRSARERAVDAAAAAAIRNSLAKAHKILVHEAVLVNVFSESALLALMEYMGKMEGVYHVRRRSFDRQNNEALIEIIGAPQSETFWRAYLEGMPKTRVNFSLNPNAEIRNRYPSWFLPTSS
jgi:hypothetical protein